MTPGEILCGLCGVVLGMIIGALVTIMAEAEMDKPQDKGKRNCG